MDENLNWNSTSKPTRAELELLLRDLGVDEVVIARACNQAEGRDVTRIATRLRNYAEKPSVIIAALSALVVGGAAVAVERTTRKKRATKKAAASRKTAARKSSARKSSRKSSSSKRTLIEPHKGDKRFIRRDAKGRIKESVDVGRSLSADRRRTSKKKAKSGQGDKGDR